MTPPVYLHALTPVAIGAFVLWRVTKRVRRLVGRQPVRPARLLLTLIVFPLLVAMLGAASLTRPDMLVGLAAGLAIGAGIGVIALRMTRYEATDQGLFYTPNTAIGVALSLLFVGRVLYRFGAVYLETGTVDPRAFQSFGSSALTLLIFGVLAGYYVAYAIGIQLWRRSSGRTAPTSGTTT